MNTTDFLSWLTAWVTRHPLRNPPASAQASYAAEVMARISRSALRAPAAAWWWRPRLVLAMGGAVAAVLIGLVMRDTPAQRLARHLDEELQQLARLDRQAAEALETAVVLSPEGLEHELRAMDRMMLAEADEVVDDEAWLDETLKLLDELDEAPEAASDDEASGDVIQELEWLDQQDLAS